MGCFPPFSVLTAILIVSVLLEEELPVHYVVNDMTFGRHSLNRRQVCGNKTLPSVTAEERQARLLLAVTERRQTVAETDHCTWCNRNNARISCSNSLGPYLPPAIRAGDTRVCRSESHHNSSFAEASRRIAETSGGTRSCGARFSVSRTRVDPDRNDAELSICRMGGIVARLRRCGWHTVQSFRKVQHCRTRLQSRSQGSRIGNGWR
jgi:hypothetical protein